MADRSPETKQESETEPQAVPNTVSYAPLTARPLHTQTQSTLAPTSEFMRYFLAALPSRYVFRGFFKTMFGTESVNGSLRNSITKIFRAPGAAFERFFHGKEAVRTPEQIKANLNGMESGSYGAALGFGSMALTISYSLTVYRDIKNLFAEVVGEELNKPADQVNINDIRHSQNKIVQKTLENFRGKLLSRLATDLLFFPAGWMKGEGLVDTALGIKGVQLFADTWKRKTTMFEDLVTFVNNKINPRNGLGQPIAQGEVFDLYQHYMDQFHPEKMFNNVLERGTGEGAVWAKSQPIFQRLTELMNETYAYKHRTELDASGRAIHRADFTLPKFIYLLGNDMIDPANPERTLILIEVANHYGIQAVKQVGHMISSGASPEQILKTFPVTLPTNEPIKPPVSEKNGVIAKGSTLQLDGADAPVNTIAGGSVQGLEPLQGMQAASQLV